jgi:Na+/pantothenate symporter
MTPRERAQMSLPPYFVAVQSVGVLALALGLITQFTNARPVLLGIAPWLGMAWVPWALCGVGLFAIFINGARMIAHARRAKTAA